jgi:hypothetical protein
MMAYQNVVELADHLSMAEKVRLIEHLSAALRQDLEIEAFRRMEWHEFIDLTAGSLALTPIQRWEQGDYEEREPLE